MVATLVSLGQLLPGFNVSHLRQGDVQLRSVPSFVRLAVGRLVVEYSTACSVAQCICWQCEKVQLQWNALSHQCCLTTQHARQACSAVTLHNAGLATCALGLSSARPSPRHNCLEALLIRLAASLGRTLHRSSREDCPAPPAPQSVCLPGLHVTRVHGSRPAPSRPPTQGF